MIPVLALLAATAQAQPAAEPNGRALFENHCTSCHASNDQRIPTVEELRARTPEAIVTALTSGAMQVQGGELNAAEKRAVAEYLAGRIVGVAQTPDKGRCTAAPPFDASAAAVAWGGWGPEPNNTRFQSAQRAGLTADQVPKLKLKWAFGFPNSATARNLPNVAGEPHLRRQPERDWCTRSTRRPAARSGRCRRMPASARRSSSRRAPAAGWRRISATIDRMSTR